MNGQKCYVDRADFPFPSIRFKEATPEVQAPTGEWRGTCGWALVWVCVGVWLYILMKIYVNNEPPDSYNRESKRSQMRRQILLHVNPITGLSSEWDYKTMDWKKKFRIFSPPPNPFRDEETGERVPRDTYRK